MCACLGGAYRAIHALKAAAAGGGESVAFAEAVASEAEEGGRSWKPQKDAVSVRTQQFSSKGAPGGQNCVAKNKGSFKKFS